MILLLRILVWQKIGYIPCDLCTFCNASPETRDHLFYLCKYAKEFWEQFEEFWM